MDFFSFIIEIITIKKLTKLCGIRYFMFAETLYFVEIKMLLLKISQIKRLLTKHLCKCNPVFII